MGVAEDLLRAACLAQFEPLKERFRYRSGQVGAITRVLGQLGHDERACFRTPKGREDFLLAALHYLSELDHEELLVAFGTRKGARRTAGASLRSVHRSVGDAHEVAMTPFVTSLIHYELEQEGAEVVLVHNHPANLAKSVLAAVLGGWRPLPSDGDRRLAQRFLELRLEHVLTARRPSSLKWYLVDEGQLCEFFLPPAAQLLDWIAGSRGKSPGGQGRAATRT